MLDDVARLFRHWAKYPPVRALVASAVGFELPPEEDQIEPEKKYMTADDLKRLMAMTGGKIPGMI